MSDVAAAAHLLRGIPSAGPETLISERTRDAARKLGWRFSRTRDVWYEQARRIDAREMDQLRLARLMEAKKAHAQLTTLIMDLEADRARLRALRLGGVADGVGRSSSEAAEGLGGMDRSRAGGAS